MPHRGSKTVRRGLGTRVNRLARAGASGGLKTVSKIAKRRGARKRKNK